MNAPSPHRPHPHGTRRSALVLAAAVLALTSCGVPTGGTPRTVDNDDVPYRLLEPATPSPSSSTGEGVPTRAPVVFWVDDEDLVPEATDEACSERSDSLVEKLLRVLSTGPSEDARAQGRSSVLPTDFGLELITLDDGTAQVGIEPTTSLSAEQLPLAVAQIVMTVSSAPGVRSVVLLDNGTPVRVPLPDGVLVDRPVTPADYREFLPERIRSLDRIGCP